MDTQNVDIFLSVNAKKFPPLHLQSIREALYAADESKYIVLTSLEFRDPDIMLLLSIVVGQFGVDRFLLGQVGMGILKLLTGGLCGILWLIDIFGVRNKAREYNHQLLKQTLGI